MTRETGKRLFLAPHLDDAAVSFGGTLLAEFATAGACGTTVVATVFSRSNYTQAGLGDAARVTPIRQAEERTVMGSLGVRTLFLGFLECPLRGYTISDPLDYPKQIKPELDASTVPAIAARLVELFSGFDVVLAPLAVGKRGHVDHRIVRLAAAAAWQELPRVVLRLYEDAPYIGPEQRTRVSALDGFQLIETRVDLDAKLRLIHGYESQPVDAWAGLIRRMAGVPAAERIWSVDGPAALARLEA